MSDIKSTKINNDQARQWILPVIVISQFFCTSLWFAGNAILPDIVIKFHLAPTFIADLTSSVQFGFITGTLVFAVLTIYRSIFSFTGFFYMFNSSGTA
jgi:hypothetical protein